MNTTKSWEFDNGIQLSGRKLRLLAQAERSSVWEVGPNLGVYTTPVPEGDATRVYMNGTAYAFLPQLTIAVQQPVPKFADASHVGDASHLQEDGRKLVIKGVQGNNLLVVRGNETNVSVTGSQMSFNVPQLSAMSDVPVLYRYDMASGSSEVWLAGTPDAERLAPMGITEAGTHVGAPSLPLRLRGSELSFNGTVLDVEQLGGSRAEAVEMEVNAQQPLPASAYVQGGTLILALTDTSGGNHVDMSTLFADMPEGVSMTVAMRLHSSIAVLNGFTVQPFMGQYVVSKACYDIENMTYCIGPLMKVGGVVYYLATPFELQYT